MKLSQLSTAQLDNAGATLHPVHPGTGSEVEGLQLRVLSKNSDVVRNRVRDFQNALARDRKFGLKNGRVDFERIENETETTIAMCVVGWTGLEDDEGKPIPFSFEKALELVRDPGLSWLRAQIDRFSSEDANFFVSAEPSLSAGLTKSSGGAAQSTPASLTVQLS